MKTKLRLILLVAVGLVFSAGSALADDPILFAKPEQAVETLDNAVSQPNLELFRQLFGADIDKLVSVNPEVRNAVMAKLSNLFDEGWSLSDAESGHRIIRVGHEGWAFPVPLVRGAEGWHFDTEAGIEEIKNRTVGRNELMAIRAMRILSDAQEAYRLKDYDGDGKKAQVDRPTNDSLHCVLASIVHVLEQPSPSAVFPSSHCSRALRAPSPQTPAHRGFHSPPKHAMQRGA